MKDHVEMDHLTKFDAFMLNRDQAIWTLRHGSKSIQMSLVSLQHPPKSYKLLKNVSQFYDNCKIQPSTDYLKTTERKITVFAHFYEYRRN